MHWISDKNGLRIIYAVVTNLFFFSNKKWKNELFNQKKKETFFKMQITLKLIYHNLYQLLTVFKINLQH